MRSRNLPGSTAGVRDLLRERRELPLGTGGRGSAIRCRAWVLELNFTLSVPAAADFDAVRLGSPGSNGREAGGYGGFFWRLPRTDELTVRTPDAVGEADVHGTVADWLAVSLRTGDRQRNDPPDADRSGHGGRQMVRPLFRLPGSRFVPGLGQAGRGGPLPPGAPRVPGDHQ